MIATIAVIAEHAEVRADGKLDVSGVYNCRYGAGSPREARRHARDAVRHRTLDYGVRQDISVHIMDEDSAEMVNLRASPVSFESPHAPGLRLRTTSFFH